MEDDPEPASDSEALGSQLKEMSQTHEKMHCVKRDIILHFSFILDPNAHMAFA